MSVAPHILASDPKQSAWVNAHAGAGKTYVLVTRLVRLMLAGTPPEKILCLTYTRNAAVEMQNRLFELLSAWALIDDAQLQADIKNRLDIDMHAAALPTARRLFAHALEAPGGLRIQTIHGFCDGLLHRFPIEAGISPEFTLMDDAMMHHCASTLLEQFLRAPATAIMAEALALLTRKMDEEKLIALTLKLISEREKVTHKDFTTIRHDIMAAVNLTQAALDGHDQNCENLLGEIAQSATAFIDILRSSGEKTDTKHADIIARFSQNMKTPDTKIAWKIIRPLFMTGSNTPRKNLCTKGIGERFSDMLTKLTIWQGRFMQLFEQHSNIKLLSQTEALYQFGKVFIESYDAYKHRQNLLDYDDLITLVNRLLTGTQAAAWVHYKIDNGIDHILVDEAQDTSPAQWQVIEALAREFFVTEVSSDNPRTIFAVGDEKQSIFSFQGADPNCFDAMRKKFDDMVQACGGRFRTIPMHEARRSVPEILQFVDNVFSNSPARQGVGVGGNKIRHTPFRADEQGMVELWEPTHHDKETRHDSPDMIPDKTHNKTAQQKLAQRIATKIDALIKDKTANIAPKDILILLRRRRGLGDEIMRALHEHNIPLAGADRMKLNEQLVIQDLLIAAEVALLPRDDLSLATFLRSPLGGVNEADLFTLAHGRAGSLWAAVKMHFAQGNECVKQAYTRLRWLMRAADYMRPFDFFAQFLSLDNLYKDMATRLGNEIDDPIDAFLRLALAYEGRETPSLTGFLHWIRHSDVELKRDMEQEQNAVRIMTIHGAKGLEAPIIFVPDTCRHMRTGGKHDLPILDDKNTLLLRLPKEYTTDYQLTMQEQAKQADHYESHRLLYVALTRARERLYIGGYLDKNQKSPAEASWYNYIARALKNDTYKVTENGETLWRVGKALPLVRLDEPALQEQLSPPPHWLYQKADPHDAMPDILVPSASETTSLGAPSAQAYKAARRGTLIHRLLENVPTLSPAMRREKAETYLRHHASEFTEAEHARMLDELFALLDNTMIKPIFSAAARVEITITGTLSRRDGTPLLVNGQIDRFIELPDKIILVDFKSGDMHDPPPIAYIRQMAIYQALMRHAKPAKPIHCYLIWTQTAHMVALAQADMDAALAKVNIA